MKNCEPETETAMKPDEFEQRLRRQSWREVPPAWRREILAAARAAGSPDHPREPAAARWWGQLSFLLWPSPRAWAAVAAAWLVILSGNLLINAGAPAASGQPMNEAHLMENLRQRQRAMAELLEPAETIESPGTMRPAPRGDLRGANRMG
jgi:hypothetical protein